MLSTSRSPPGTIVVAACFVATFIAPSARAADLPGFKLDGERWTYKHDDLEMDGVLLKPAGDGPFPAVLISHGLGGNAEGFGTQKAREFVRWGFVCIAPNYTHSRNNLGPRPPPGRAPNANYGASDENLRRASTCCEFLGSQPYVDKTRLAAYGHSMGGFVTIGLAAKQPELLKAAAITGSGVAPRAGYAAPSTEQAGKIKTPFLMIHGGDDATVRPDQSASLKEILDRNGVPAEREVFDGIGHPVDQQKSREVFDLLKKWFSARKVLQS